LLNLFVVVVGGSYEIVGHLSVIFSLKSRSTTFVVLFLNGFCFCFQGFVLVPSNPETPSKSRDFFQFSMHKTAKVSFCSFVPLNGGELTRIFCDLLCSPLMFMRQVHEASKNPPVISGLSAPDPLRARHFVERT